MKKTRVAINGFGRIGRAFFRMSYGHSDFEVVAINDLGDIKNLAYLLEYDTVYGRSPYTVSVADGALLIDGKKVLYTSEREPANLPWRKQEVDIVMESTGVYCEQICHYLYSIFKALSIEFPKLAKIQHSSLLKTQSIGRESPNIK